MKDLTIGKESRLIFNFALPMIAGNILQQLYNVVDSVIVGRFIGKEALAAVGASFPVIFTLIALVIGITMGATIIISQYFGAKEFENVKKTIDTVNIFLFFSSILITIIGILFADDIFVFLKLPAEILGQARLYMNIYLSGMVFMFGFNGVSAILRGIGDSKTPLFFLAISTFVNIAFDLLFVIVFKMGIAGAAIATVLSQAGAFIIAIIYLNKNHKIIQFAWKGLVFDKWIFRESIRIGLPSGLQQTFVSLGFVALLGIVNAYGTDVIAGYTAAMRIDSLAVLPAMNFSIALSTFVGQNLGANKFHRIKTGFLATFYMSGAISIIVTIFVLFFGKTIMALFTNDIGVITVGNDYLVIISSFYIIFNAMFLTNGVLRGAGDTLIPMFITLISLWLVRIPLAYILSNGFSFNFSLFQHTFTYNFPFKMGEKGIWWAVPVAWIIGLILSYSYYLTGRWKTKSVFKN